MLVSIRMPKAADDLPAPSCSDTPVMESTNGSKPSLTSNKSIGITNHLGIKAMPGERKVSY